MQMRAIKVGNWDLLCLYRSCLNALGMSTIFFLQVVLLRGSAASSFFPGAGDSHFCSTFCSTFFYKNTEDMKRIIAPDPAGFQEDELCLRGGSETRGD